MRPIITILALIIILFSCSNDDDDKPNNKSEDKGPFIYFEGLLGMANYADFQTDGTLVYQGTYQLSSGQLGERGVYKIDKNGKLVINFDWGRDKSWWPVKGEFGSESWGDIFVHGDGVLLTGEYVVDGRTYNLIRLKSDGSLDREFLNNSQIIATVRKITVTKENSIFVTFERRVVKLNPDGSVDNSFIFNREGSFNYGSLRNTIPLPDGKVFVTGGFGLVYGGYLWRSIVKLRSDGRVDGPAFSFYEKLETSVVSGVISEGYVSNAIVQSDGKILINGDFFRIIDETQRDTHHNYRNIARLHPNGEVDTSFKPQEESAQNGIFQGLNDNFYYRQRFVGLEHSSKLYHSDKDGNLLAEFSPDGEFRGVFPLSNNEALVAGSFYVGHGDLNADFSPLVHLKK